MRKNLTFLIFFPAERTFSDRDEKEKSLRSLSADSERTKEKILSVFYFPATAFREIFCGRQKETSLRINVSQARAIHLFFGLFQSVFTSLLFLMR